MMFYVEKKKISLSWSSNCSSHWGLSNGPKITFKKIFDPPNFAPNFSNAMILDSQSGHNSQSGVCMWEAWKFLHCILTHFPLILEVCLNHTMPLPHSTSLYPTFVRNPRLGSWQYYLHSVYWFHLMLHNALCLKCCIIIHVLSLLRCIGGMCFNVSILNWTNPMPFSWVITWIWLINLDMLLLFLKLMFDSYNWH